MISSYKVLFVKESMSVVFAPFQVMGCNLSSFFDIKNAVTAQMNIDIFCQCRI